MSAELVLYSTDGQSELVAQRAKKLFGWMHRFEDWNRDRPSSTHVPGEELPTDRRNTCKISGLWRAD
jgi:hypothetical protein